MGKKKLCEAFAWYLEGKKHPQSKLKEVMQAPIKATTITLREKAM